MANQSSTAALFSGITSFFTLFFALSIIIGIHEFGHFSFAKIFNIDVPTFSIGFGPTILEKKIGETRFRLAAIPLGGYTEIAGMANGRITHVNPQNSFEHKSYWQKLLVLFGGVLFNIIFAYIVMIFLALRRRKLTTHIKQVQTGSPSALLGLEAGDQITAVNNQPTHNKFKNLLKLLRQEETTRLEIARDGITQEIVISAQNIKNIYQDVQFNISHADRVSLSTAILTGIHAANQIIIDVWQSIKQIFTKTKIKQITNPINMALESAIAQKQGGYLILFFLAALSLNLAVFNLIPIPILDGGQIAIYTAEAVVSRRIPLYIREYLAILSWLLIIGLMAYVSMRGSAKSKTS